MDLKPVAILFLVAIYCGCGKGNYKAMKSILPVNVTLQDGDVIFRKGTGMARRVVTTADNDGIYSHVGIVVRKGDALMVVHAVPDEHDFDGDVDRVKLDSLGRFYSESYASRGEIMRHSDSIAASMAARKALEVYERGTLFDNDYDDEDTSRLCCTELIKFVYASTGHPLDDVNKHTMKVLNITTNCSFPSDLQGSKYLRTITLF